MKASLLTAEGHVVQRGRIAHFTQRRWDGT